MKLLLSLLLSAILPGAQAANDASFFSVAYVEVTTAARQSASCRVQALSGPAGAAAPSTRHLPSEAVCSPLGPTGPGGLAL